MRFGSALAQSSSSTISMWRQHQRGEPRPPVNNIYTNWLYKINGHIHTDNNNMNINWISRWNKGIQTTDISEHCTVMFVNNLLVITLLFPTLSFLSLIIFLSLFLYSVMINGRGLAIVFTHLVLSISLSCSSKQHLHSVQVTSPADHHQSSILFLPSCQTRIQIHSRIIIVRHKCMFMQQRSLCF